MICISIALALPTAAQVPGLLNYQGRIAVGTAAFNGTGEFKFALVNGDASQTYWRNAPDANLDGQPDNAVSLGVTRGQFSVVLGDTGLANMAALPAEVFTNSAVYSRTWFNDGNNGFQLLTPDQRVSAAGYAMMANVQDGAITPGKLAPSTYNTLSNLAVAAVQPKVDVSTDPQDAALVAKGYRFFMNVPAAAWINGAANNEPAARNGHSAVWTGNEMIVWGGYLGANAYSRSGGRYVPALDAWTSVSTFAAPSARQSHSAIWSGTEMFVWGGLGNDGHLNTGGRYQPASQLWKVVNAIGAPSARSDHACVWAGSRMLVWGGNSLAGYLADGALYDPADNQWTALTTPDAPEPRRAAAAVWTGDRFVVWGGEGASALLNSGGRLSFNAGVPQQWLAIATDNAPAARTGHSAVWTGQKVIVWGGRNGGSFYGDGALYDPLTDVWTTLPTIGAPSARAGHVAVWTGGEMVVFGGEDATGSLATGAAYDVTANKWRSLNNAGQPVARSGAKAVWSGTELLLFGGQVNGQRVAALQRLNPQPAWYFYRKL